MDKHQRRKFVRSCLEVKEMSEEEIERCCDWVLDNWEVRETGKSNADGLKKQINKTWNIEWLEQQLQGYEGVEDLKFIKYGWTLNASDTEENQRVPRNQAGARKNTQKLQEYINKELR